MTHGKQLIIFKKISWNCFLPCYLCRSIDRYINSARKQPKYFPLNLEFEEHSYWILMFTLMATHFCAIRKVIKKRISTIKIDSLFNFISVFFCFLDVCVWFFDIGLIHKKETTSLVHLILNGVWKIEKFRSSSFWCACFFFGFFSFWLRMIVLKCYHALPWYFELWFTYDG